MKNTAKRIVSFAAAFTFATVSSAVYAEEGNTITFGFAGTDNETEIVDFGAVGSDETTVSVVLNVEETYIITIPKEVSLHPVPNSSGKLLIEGDGIVSAGNVFIVPKEDGSVGSVNVKISEDSVLTISNNDNLIPHILRYKVSNSNDKDVEYHPGETVLSVESDTTGETHLKFTLTENPKYMEIYSGTITFEVTGFTPTT